MIQNHPAIGVIVFRKNESITAQSECAVNCLMSIPDTNGTVSLEEFRKQFLES